MNVHKVNLEMTAGRVDQFPVDEIKEIAFAGRSNVGKSSLLNTMINRKSFARTSAAPGKTRTINFYNIDETVRFVDLPGYGYANVSKKSQEGWLKIIDNYLNDRKNLKCIALLLDIRRDPTVDDMMMVDFMRTMDIPFIVIITKVDKLGKTIQQKHVHAIMKALKLGREDNVVPFSSIDKTGKDALWNIIIKELEIEDDEIKGI